MKRLGILPLSPGWDTILSQGYSPPVPINNPGWREALRELCLAHEHNNITRHYISGHCNPPPLPASCLGSVIFLLWPSPSPSLEVDLQSIFYSPLYTLLATTDSPPPVTPWKQCDAPKFPPSPHRRPITTGALPVDVWIELLCFSFIYVLL